jgi:hypothetical protein
MELDYDVYKDEVIVIRFDSEMLKGFTGYDKNNPDEYFKAHPKAKRPPLDNLFKKKRLGMIPSINFFMMSTNRMIMGDWEKALKQYCEYCMIQQNIKHDYISECIVVAIQFKDTKGKADVNNIYTKPFIDAMVERELIQEDNYTVVRMHQEYIVVDKSDPHSEIRIYPITEQYDIEFVLWYIQQDILTLEKQYNQG